MNHVVTVGALREAHTNDTRQRIVDAVAALLVEEHPATLSVPAVAARAGVSLRTVYRYFPTKEALLDGVANGADLPVRATMPGGRLDADTLDLYLPALWQVLADQLPYVRAHHTSPAGMELRRRRLPEHRAEVRAALVKSGLKLAPADLRRLTDLIVAVTSSGMLLDLVDHQGHPVDEAAAMAVFAVCALIAHARTTKEVARGH
jgi:AcrR family transcriptional regulator